MAAKSTPLQKNSGLFRKDPMTQFEATRNVRAFRIQPCKNTGTEGGKPKVEVCHYREAQMYGLYSRAGTGAMKHLKDFSTFNEAMEEAHLWAAIFGVKLEYWLDSPDLLQQIPPWNPSQEFQTRPVMSSDVRRLLADRDTLMHMLRHQFQTPAPLKLVRDHIPEMFPQNEYAQAGSDDLYGFLKEKLREEIDEYLAAPLDQKESELADVTEVLKALSQIENIDWPHVYTLQEQKTRERGGFTQGWVLTKLGDQ